MHARAVTFGVAALVAFPTAALAATAPPDAAPSAAPAPISPSPGVGLTDPCPFCGLPVPPSRTGPIVAAGTAIALDGVGVLVFGSAALLRRRRRRSR